MLNLRSTVRLSLSDEKLLEYYIIEIPPDSWAPGSTHHATQLISGEQLQQTMKGKCFRAWGRITRSPHVTQQRSWKEANIAFVRRLHKESRISFWEESNSSRKIRFVAST